MAGLDDRVCWELVLCNLWDTPYST